VIAPFAAVVLAVLPGFTNLSLSDAEARVVSTSAGVATARAAVVERDAELRLARSGGVPHLTGDYTLAPQAPQNGDIPIEQHVFAVGAGISINDLLSAPAATQSAAAELVAAQRDADAAVLSARSQTVKLYFAALKSIAVESVRAEALSGALRDRNAAQLRERNGDAPALDVVRADVTVAQARADLARAQADRGDAVDALASAANVPVSVLAVSPGAFAASYAAPDPTRSVERALAVRPEIASLLASIDARSADVAAARQSGFPAITANGGYQAGVDSGIPVRGPAAAVHVDVPLSSGRNDRVGVAQARVELVRAQLYEQRRTIALDVASAVRDARAATAAAAAADRAGAEAARALAAVELGYREGASSSLDVSEGRRLAVQSSVDALVARYDEAQAFALLEVLVP
jgi:outer membrane protein TolC